MCCCGLDVGFVQEGAQAAEINDLPQLEVESNDTVETANALQLVEDPAGSGCFVVGGTGEIDPAVYGDYWSDPDFWSFEALAGDVVSIAVETPLSDVNSYVELRNAANTNLAGDDNGGPDYDSFESHYSIATSGTYYAVVGKSWHSTTTGSYELRVDVARGIDLETDRSYSNDTTSGASWVTLAKGAPGHTVGAAAGTVMGSEGANTDEDHFELGVLNAGSTVTLDLPALVVSTLDGRLTLIDSAGASVTDDDGSGRTAIRSSAATRSEQTVPTTYACNGKDTPPAPAATCCALTLATSSPARQPCQMAAHGIATGHVH